MKHLYLSLALLTLSAGSMLRANNLDAVQELNDKIQALEEELAKKKAARWVCKAHSHVHAFVGEGRSKEHAMVDAINNCGGHTDFCKVDTCSRMGDPDDSLVSRLQELEARIHALETVKAGRRFACTARGCFGSMLASTYQGEGSTEIRARNQALIMCAQVMGCNDCSITECEEVK